METPRSFAVQARWPSRCKTAVELSDFNHHRTEPPMAKTTMNQAELIVKHEESDFSASSPSWCCSC